MDCPASGAFILGTIPVQSLQQIGRHVCSERDVLRFRRIFPEPWAASLGFFLRHKQHLNWTFYQKGMKKAMAEYIEREQALAAISLGANRHHMAELVREAPAANVVEQKIGTWKKIGADKRGRGAIFICSACDKCNPVITAFCPNCGAKMTTANHDS